MSWDIFVHDIPASITTIEEIPDGFKPRIIGKRSDIIARIQEVVPTADFTRPDWGTIDTPDYSIEVNMGVEDELDGFAFHVRGGDAAVHVVADILDHLGLRAFDPNSENGLFPAGLEAEASLLRWPAYRDQVVEKPLKSRSWISRLKRFFTN